MHSTQTLNFSATDLNGIGKINAIKAVREYATQTFGQTAGLKESKDFIDSLCSKISEARKKAFDDSLRELLKNNSVYELADYIYYFAGPTF